VIGERQTELKGIKRERERETERGYVMASLLRNGASMRALHESTPAHFVSSILMKAKKIKLQEKNRNDLT
jgi:hypothetical protein